MTTQRKAIVSLGLLSALFMLLIQVTPLKLIFFIAAWGALASAAYLAYRQMALTPGVSPKKTNLILFLVAGSAFLFSFLALYWARH